MTIYDLKETRNKIEAEYIANHLGMGKLETRLFDTLMKFLDDFIERVEKRENATAT